MPLYKPIKRYKRSAVAEMGDRARAKWAEKWGRLLCPSLWGQLGPYLTQCRLGPTSVPSGILFHPAVWPQYTNVTDRQDRQRSRRWTVTCNGRPEIKTNQHSL